MSSASDRARVRRRIVAVILLGTVAALAVVLIVTLRRRTSGPGHIVVPTASGEADPAPPDPRVLRVCADPNNLPFSNADRRGFENRIVELVAADLGRRVEYYWQPQRRGFVRTTLRAGRCDVIPGIPTAIERLRVTRPYYRSTYVFVSRRDRRLNLRSLDDPRLHALRIGVQVVGDDYENPPAAQALAARHIVDNVRGFMVYGDYSKPDPLRAVVDAVADRRVDVAIAWGPMAGYFARQQPVAMTVEPVTPEVDGKWLRFAYDISMGVRRADRVLGTAIDHVLAARGDEIRRILHDYAVPVIERQRPVRRTTD